MPPFSPFTSEYDGCMPCPDQLIRFLSVFPPLYQLLFADLTCLLPSNCDVPSTCFHEFDGRISIPLYFFYRQTRESMWRVHHVGCEFGHSPLHAIVVLYSHCPKLYRSF
jgi:hypothetical protein